MRTNQRRFAGRVLPVLLVLCMIISLFPLIPHASAADKLGRFNLISQTEYAVSPGVTEKNLLLNSTNGNEQNKGYLMEINLGDPNVTIKAGYKDYNPTSWGMQRPSEQAAAAEKVFQQTDPNANVVGVVNANFFNMSTGEPSGALVMHGVKYHETASRFGYLAILKDGTAEIRSGSTPIGEDVAEAMAGETILVRDGKVTSEVSDDPVLYPRTAVGIKADGSVLLYVNDGRQAPVSVGMTFRELAEVMRDLGCVDALNLDGGGSATFMTEREGTGDLSIKNSVSDGFERSVSGTLLVVSTAKPSGVFDHASLSPNGSFYTPGTTVPFSALGVDSAGVNVALPEGLTWALEDESMGSIDASTGVFTANEKTGPVTVQLKQGEEVVGSTMIQIQAPDKISFLNPAINLSYGQVTDLGMSASYQGNALIIKDGDFDWSVVETEGNGEAGTFSGNTFTASVNNEARNLSVTAVLQAVSKWNPDVTGKIEVSIGKEPVIILDGGEKDGDGLDYHNIALVHAAPNGGGLVYHTHEDDHGDVVIVNYNRGGKGTAESVDLDHGMVRFGEKSLKLNFDFTDTSGTEGASVGFDHDIPTEGNPTAIGFWCYAPEYTPNLWVRIRVRDGHGQTQNLNFTVENNAALNDLPKDDWNYGTKGGINWFGWRYLEADLSGIEGPITLMAGETIRIMDVPGTQMGRWAAQKDSSGTIVVGPEFIGPQKGTIYIDNLQLLYGTNNADTKNPEIKLLQAGPTLDSAVDLAGDGSTVINSNEVTFYSEFADAQDENTSGLDFGYLYLDGKNMSDNANFVSDMNDGKLLLNAMKLANGTHTVKVLVHDKYGNEAVVSRTFTVQGNDGSLTSVNLEPQGNTAPLGGQYQIDLTSNRAEDVKAVAVEMTVGNAEVSGIDWAEDYKDSTYSFEDGVLTINAVRAEDAQSQGDTTIGSIRMDIPRDLQAGSFLTYEVTEGSVTYATAKDSNVVNTFALPTTRIPVTAAYQVTFDVVYEGAEGSDITVTDADGNPVPYVKVYLQTDEGDQLLGTTGRSGELGTSELVEKEQFVVYAAGSAGYSFPTSGKRLPTVGDKLPTYIIENATQDAYTTKSISWVADPATAAHKAVLEYAPAGADFETAKIAVNGETTLKGFVDAAVLINSVTVTGLDANTEYQYRVGDGRNWSDVSTFKTANDDVDAATNIFILGDTQTEGDDITNATEINKRLAGDGTDYALGIQLGDAVEDIVRYDSWTDFLNMMEQPKGAFGSNDMLHVIGNHELSGDPGATAAKAMFGIEQGTEYYSVRYGNVYIATIDYCFDTPELQRAAEWLKQDAAASDAPWKILVLHQPPYYTNPEGGSNIVNQILPPAIDAAGIDVVFSGHDHAYARTKPLTNYEVDEANGTVYYIAGSTGEKSYTAVNNPDFHFDFLRGAGQPSGFKAIYLTLSATDNTLSVNTFDLDEGIIDTFHRTKNVPCAEGEHSWVYRPGRDLLLCEKCLARLDKAEYSGFAKMENTESDQVYMIGGVLQTGWITVDNEMLHAGDDYILHETETRDTRTCTDNGHIETVCKTCGATYRGSETFAKGHVWDENHVCTVCGKQGIDIATLDGKVSSPRYVYKGQTVRPMPTVKDGDYTLNITNSTMGRDGYVSWERYDRIGTATVIVEGRGNYYGTLRIDYDLVPDKAKDVTVSDNTEDGATLSWTAVPGAETYKVYVYDFDVGQQVEIAATADDSTTIAVTGLEANKTYKVCVKACVTVDGKDYVSAQYDWVNLTTIPHTHSLTAVAQVDATCTETGTEAYWKCDDCGKLFSDAAGKHEINAPVVIPVKAHDTEVKGAKDATCVDAGYTGDEVCKVCGTVVKQGEAIPAKGHDTGLQGAKDATCVDAGYTGDEVCKVCGTVVKKGAVIPAKGHDTEVKGAKDATCVDAGYTGDEVCKVCGAVVKQGETIPAKGHSWGDWVVTVEPTETEKGEEMHTCSVCGVTDTRPVPELAHVHKLTAVAKVDATCTEPGMEAYWKCEGCGKLFADADATKEIEAPAVIAAKGHNWGDWTVTKEATVDAEGEETRTCSVCGEKETRPIDKLEPQKPDKCNGGDDCPSIKLTDVDRTPTSWYHEAVDWAFVKGVTNGTSETTFSPDQACTRAQAVTFLWRANGSPEPTLTKNNFVDVPVDAYYYKAVLWAVENKITNGVDETHFAPEMACSRAHIVTFLYRAAGSPEVQNTKAFSDVPAGEWYANAVAWAAENEITNGVSNDLFAPTKDCTRSEIVTFLYRDEMNKQ